jgi:hypothetical protein
LLNDEKTGLLAKLTNIEENSSKLLSEEVGKKSVEFDAALAKREVELKAEFSQSLDNLKKEHEEFIVLIKNDFTSQNSQLTDVINLILGDDKIKIFLIVQFDFKEITRLNSKLKELNDQIYLLQNSLTGDQQVNKELNEKVLSLSEEIRVKEESYLKQVEELKSQSGDTEKSFK